MMKTDFNISSKIVFKLLRILYHLNPLRVTEEVAQSVMCLLHKHSNFTTPLVKQILLLWYSVHYQKRKITINPATNPAVYTGNLSNAGTSMVGATNHCLVGFKAQSIR